MPSFYRDGVIKTQILWHCSRLFLGEFYKIFVQLCNAQIDFCRALSQADSWDRLHQTPATLSARESGYRKWIDERIYFLMHLQQTLYVWKYICNPKLKNKCIRFKCVIAKSDILLSTVSNDKAEKVVMLASMTAFKPVVDLSGW